MLKELFPGSTDFTEAIFKIPQISKHFSAMLFGIVSLSDWSFPFNREYEKTTDRNRMSH